MSNMLSPVSVVPCLSDLLTVHTDKIKDVQSTLFVKFMLNRADAVQTLIANNRTQDDVLEATFRSYETRTINDDVFLGGINNHFAVTAGFRFFLLNVVEYLIQAEGPASAEGRSCLLEAEQELEAEMNKVLERVKAAAHDQIPQHLLYWEEEKGLFLHKVNIVEPGFGAW